MNKRKNEKGLKKGLSIFLGKTLADSIIRVILVLMAVGVVIYYFMVNGFSLSNLSTMAFGQSNFNTNGFYSTSSYSNNNGGAGFEMGFGHGGDGGEGHGSGDGGGHGGGGE